MNKFVGLGGNCGTTYQLVKHRKRFEAYPFDWCLIKNIKTLNKILECDFDNFVETISFMQSKSHFILDNDIETSENSLLIKNEYGCRWAHEIKTEEEILNFKKSMYRRIDRFRNLECADFIRVELSPIKDDYINQVLKLKALLKQYCQEFNLHLIIPNVNIEIDGVNIYTYNNFNPDWKLDYIDFFSDFH